MNVFGRMRVSMRMLLLVALTLVGLLILCFIALAQLRGTMLEDRKQSTRNIVEVGIGILAHHHQLAQEGKLSEDAAKNAARESLRGLRYGSNDYLYIYLTNGISFLHPIRKDFEGQDKRDLKDSNGKLLIQAIIAVGQQPGGGFVDFWFPRPGKETAEPKLGYSATFAPWSMVVGTGVYIDDIDREFKKSALILGGISFVLLAALSVAGWLVSSSVLRHLGGEPAAAVSIMRKVADGDLTAGVGSPPDGSLLHALGSMVTSLRELVREINSDARLLASNASNINVASAEVAAAADRQADATSSMAAAIEQLTVSSTHISDSARETEGDSLQAMQQANEGSARVMQATQAIQKIAATVTDASGRIHALEERAGQISTIASVIKDIAGQTNLLALNAAIEAARAGEQGRGFAVVADEVRKLAERTSLATMEIEHMISGIQGDTSGAVEAMNAALPEVEQGVQLANLATQSLQTIESGANRTLVRVREIANATLEQGSASTSIAQRVEQIAQMVEETTGNIRGTSDMAKQLEDVAQKLRMQIERFKV